MRKRMPSEPAIAGGAMARDPDTANHPRVRAKGPGPTRRGFVAGLASAVAGGTASVAHAYDVAAPEDVAFMRMAIAEARRGDFPFGAVIVRDGKVIARGRNLGRTHGDPTAHGEMVAIRRCAAVHGRDALRGSTLYTSGEPCPMCMGAILWSRVGRLVYAASIDQLATRLDQIMLSSVEVSERARFAPISITGGVLADEAMQLFAR